MLSNHMFHQWSRQELKILNLRFRNYVKFRKLHGAEETNCWMTITGRLVIRKELLNQPAEVTNRKLFNSQNLLVTLFILLRSYKTTYAVELLKNCKY